METTKESIKMSMVLSIDKCMKRSLILKLSLKFLFLLEIVNINMLYNVTIAEIISIESKKSEMIIFWDVSGTSWRMVPRAIEKANTRVQQSELRSDLLGGIRNETNRAINKIKQGARRV